MEISEPTADADQPGHPALHLRLRETRDTTPGRISFGDALLVAFPVRSADVPYRWALRGELAPFADLLRTAEVVHTGKGATFGLGWMRIDGR